jgi:UDP-N-acetyl-2-amino-2-deoxyglucuronate dehydrogenase
LDGGGALMNQSIHAIDLLQWFVGPVKELVSFTGTIAHDQIEVEDTAVAAIRFRNGAFGVIEGSTGAYPGFLKRIEISGSKGSVIMEEEDLLTWDFQDELPEDTAIREEFSHKNGTGGGASDPAAISFHGHQYQFENMIAAIETGEQLLVDGREARKAVEIIQAIYLSADEKKLIQLPLISN